MLMQSDKIAKLLLMILALWQSELIIFVTDKHLFTQQLIDQFFHSYLNMHSTTSF